jgi:hypothetical protein
MFISTPRAEEETMSQVGLIPLAQITCLLQRFHRSAAALTVGLSAERRSVLHNVSYIHINFPRGFGGRREEESWNEVMTESRKSPSRGSLGGGKLGHGNDLAH